jgi:hypothetical protein
VEVEQMGSEDKAATKAPAKAETKVDTSRDAKADAEEPQMEPNPTLDAFGNDVNAEGYVAPEDDASTAPTEG